jgi:transcriptional regulator with XRE-family HTH domain
VNSTDSTIGELLFRLRKERGWTQKELAEKIEIHPNHIGRIEKGGLQPRRSTLEAFAKVFGTDVDDLLTLAGVNERGLARQLSEEDPDLAALMSQVPLLEDEQKDAPRVFLRSMVTCQRLQSLASGRLS